MPDVTIVGAGWAGLACAVSLTEQGARVALVDAAPTVGGRGRTVRIELAGQPLKLDNGQHLLVGAYHRTLEFVDKLGSEALPGLDRHRMCLAMPEKGFLLGRAALPGRLGHLVGLLRARGLTWRDRIAMARLIEGLRMRRWRHTAVTVADLFRAFGQSRPICDLLWIPLCVGALNTAPEHACARAFIAVLRDSLGGAGGDSDFLWPAGTLGELLPEPALRWLARREVVPRLGCLAQGILPDADGWRLSIREASPVSSAAIVVATPPSNAARLLRELAPGVANGLDRFEMAPIATVYLAWPQACELPRIAMLVDEPGRGRPGQWLFDRGVHAGLRVGAVVISDGGRFPQVSPDRLAELVAAQVRSLGLPPSLDARAIVERRATFRCVPGRPRLDASSVQRELGSGARIFLAGDYLDPEYPATLESAIRAGLAAAQRVRESLGG